MEINEFLKNFAQVFDDTDPSEIKSETSFRDLDEWGSLTGLAVLNMIVKKYGVKVTPAELRACVTIADVHALVESKLV